MKFIKKNPILTPQNYKTCEQCTNLRFLTIRAAYSCSVGTLRRETETCCEETPMNGFPNMSADSSLR